MRQFLVGLIEEELQRAAWKLFLCLAGLGLSPVPWRGGNASMSEITVEPLELTGDKYI